MNKALAQHGVRLSFQINRRSGEYLTLIKDHLSPQDFQERGRLVAEAIDKINVSLINTVLKYFPEIYGEIEQDIKNYNRFL